MSNRTLKVIPLGVAAVATVLHDGTNAPDYPSKLEGFVVQALGDTHFGGASVTGTADGFTVRNGEAVNVLGFLSRGSPYSYDLTQLYYIGGPWKLIVEENAT